MSALRVAVLASGAGTNLQALLDAVHGRDGIAIVAVAGDKPGARALDRAQAAGIETHVFPRADYEDRVARDIAIADWLAERRAELVVLAGYMQILSPAFLRRFPDRVINVHPALLPSFPGVNAIEQAVEHGVRVTGVTVHFVDEGVDSGPIILQSAIDLPQDVTAEQAHDLLRPLEHRLLPEAVRLIARDAVAIDPANPRRTRIAGGA